MVLQGPALDVARLRAAFAQLSRDVEAPHVRAWLDAERGKGAVRWLFLDFVDAYVELFAGEDPDLRLSDGAAKALADRVKLLANGHVALARRADGDADDDDAGFKKKKKKKRLVLGGGFGGSSSDDASRRSEESDDERAGRGPGALMRARRGRQREGSEDSDDAPRGRAARARAAAAAT